MRQSQSHFWGNASSSIEHLIDSKSGNAKRFSQLILLDIHTIKHSPTKHFSRSWRCKFASFIHHYSSLQTYVYRPKTLAPLEAQASFHVDWHTPCGSIRRRQLVEHEVEVL